MNKPRPQLLSGDSFLVRIWWETRDMPGAPLVWRGRVEHVPSGRTAYFDEIGKLVAFIEDKTGLLSPPMAGEQEEKEEGK